VKVQKKRGWKRWKVIEWLGGSGETEQKRIDETGWFEMAWRKCINAMCAEETDVTKAEHTFRYEVRKMLNGSVYNMHEGKQPVMLTGCVSPQSTHSVDASVTSLGWRWYRDEWKALTNKEFSRAEITDIYARHASMRCVQQGSKCCSAVAIIRRAWDRVEAKTTGKRHGFPEVNNLWCPVMDRF